MVAKKQTVDIDLQGWELQNAVIQNLSTAPSNPKAGQIYFDTANNTEYVYDGTNWVDALSQGRIYTEGTGIDINGSVISVDTSVIAQQSDLPTKVSDLTNDSGYITGITGSDVTTALGFTPYNATNPSGYQANVIETVKVNGSALTPSSKAVDITVPTTVASLTDASDYAKVASLATVATTGAYSDLTGTPTVDQTYSGTSTNAQSGTAVKSAIDAAISSTYKPAGSVAFASLPTLGSSINGNVYNVTDAFTTTSDFVEGAGKSYPAGTNVVCINTTGSTYKWDVLAGFVDLSGYQTTITGGATTITSSDLTASRALISNGSGKVDVSDVTSTELGYLDGVTSSIQTQLNGKEATISDLSTIRSGASKGATATQKLTATNPALTATGGVCTWTISNTLATSDVDVRVYLVSTGEEYVTGVTTSSSNVVIKMNSASNISAGTYKAVIIG